MEGLAVMRMMEFYRNKRVLVTGHTGFKGSWLCKILTLFGADVTGYALTPPKAPAPINTDLFSLSNLANGIHSVIGDIRDLAHLSKTYQEVNPEIVFHLAAQPLVCEGYANPRYTYETNVMGTVNLLECVKASKDTKSVLNVTTDKVYLNREWEWGYRENEPLDGYDPYSNSKSCSELVTHSYIHSFFNDKQIAVSTARAGNVIGGGDFADNRIIPDCVRAALQEQTIIVRNPHSVRPYQHVLEPLFAYLLVAQRQWEDSRLSGYYNVGPDDCDCVTTGTLVELFCQKWGNGLRWETQHVEGPHEANYLKLDCAKLKKTFRWHSCWHITQAVEKTVNWTLCYKQDRQSIISCMDEQIKEYRKKLEECKHV